MPSDEESLSLQAAVTNDGAGMGFWVNPNLFALRRLAATKEIRDRSH